MEVKLIISAYFLIVLAIGVFSYFKIKTPDDYFLSGKKAGVIQVTGSMMATILGGSAILGTIELSQKNGWPAIWFLSCASLGLLLLMPLTKRISYFGHYTMPEMLGLFYGEKARIIASIIIPIAWIGIVAVQIIASAKILSGLGFISYNQSAVLAGLVFIIYTLIGGQTSVLKTDTIQSAIILIGFVIVMIFSLKSSSIEPLESFKLNALFNDKFSPIDLIILILTYSVTFVVGPDIYSRVFCAKDEKTARRSIFLTAILLILIAFVLTWMGVFSKSSSKEGVVAFVSEIMPPWAYGLFIAALLSALISSGTTLINAAMILSELTTGSLKHKRALFLTGLYIVLIGTAGITIALYISRIIETLLFALAIFSGAFIVPTIAGLMRFKVNPKNAIYAIIAGGALALSGKLLTDILHIPSGNILIISSHLLNATILFWPNRKGIYS